MLNMMYTIKHLMLLIMRGTGFVNNSNHIGKTRYNAGLGLAVTPIENMSISATVNHKQSSHWKNNSVNMSLNYQF